MLIVVCAAQAQNVESFFSTHSTVVLYIIVALVLLAAIFIKWRTNSDDESSHVIVSLPTQQYSVQKRVSVITGISNIKSVDCNFSLISFEDFAMLLFVQYHEFLGTYNLKSVQPFFGYEIINNSNFVHSNAVVDYLHIYDIRTEKDTTYIVLEFFARYISKVRNTEEITAHCESCVERWLFSRNVKYKSPHQPSPLGKLSGFCNDWQVRSISLVSTGRVSEKPTPFFNTIKKIYKVPTKYHDLEIMFCNYHRGEFSDFSQFCNNVAEPSFLSLWRNFYKGGFKNLYKYTLSENLLNILSYYCNHIESLNLVPKIKNVEILESTVIDYMADNYFEAITVKIVFSCLDYVEQLNNNQVVAGNNHKTNNLTAIVLFMAPHRKVLDRKTDYIIYNINRG